MAGKSTETANLSLWKLMDSKPTAKESVWTDLGSLHVGDSCTAWSFVGLRPVPDR